MFIAKSFAKKHYKGAMDAMKSLSGKAKNEAALVKLAGVKNYSKLRMNRMKKSSTFKKLVSDLIYFDKNLLHINQVNQTFHEKTLT